MVTTIGNESSIEKLVEILIYLEHDAIATYDSTIEKLENAEAKQEVTGFREDHKHHLSTLRAMARELGIEAPKEGDMKQLLTTGKIAIAGLIGDGAILKAMKTNEDDAVTAYERASKHKDAIDKSKIFFGKALADERRHRSWMEQTGASFDSSR